MAFDLNRLLRPHFAGIKPYSSARDEYAGQEGVFLDANENPFTDPSGGSFNRYPDPYQHAVKEKLSKIKGISKSQIFLGNGSDEAIDLLVRAFCVPGIDNVMLLPPTYGMYEVSASINDVMVTRIPLSEDFQLIPSEILSSFDAQTKIVFICSPNNPSGNKMRRDDIRAVLKGFPGVVVIDEAYIDFSDEPSFIHELDDFPNLLVLQTFSKAWGMANLRIGMAFGSLEIIQVLNRIKPPYNISGLTQEKVLEALENTKGLSKTVSSILEERHKLAAELQHITCVKFIYPSDANFLLVRTSDAKAIYRYLIEKTIIVRDRSSVLLCENCLRITVGTPEENSELVRALANYPGH